MYLLRTHRLARELRAGTVTSGQALGYLIVCLLLQLLEVLLPNSPGWVPNELDTIAVWVTTVLGIVLVALCFRANRRGDDRDFALRFLSLYCSTSLVLLVLLLALYWPLWFLVFILADQLTTIESISFFYRSRETSPFEAIYITAWNLLQLLWMFRLFNRISGSAPLAGETDESHELGERG